MQYECDGVFIRVLRIDEECPDMLDWAESHEICEIYIPNTANVCSTCKQVLSNMIPQRA